MSNEINRRMIVDAEMDPEKNVVELEMMLPASPYDSLAIAETVVIKMFESIVRSDNQPENILALANLFIDNIAKRLGTEVFGLNTPTDKFS